MSVKKKRSNENRLHQAYAKFDRLKIVAMKKGCLESDGYMVKFGTMKISGKCAVIANKLRKQEKALNEASARALPKKARRHFFGD